jgi:putative membrane protein
MERKERSALLWLAAALALAVGLMALFAAFAAPYDGGFGMMGWGMSWGVLFMAIPAVFLILVLLAALGAFTPSPAYVAPPSSALETLNVRYARGEISRDEYLQMRADLERRLP